MKKLFRNVRIVKFDREIFALMLTGTHIGIDRVGRDRDCVGWSRVNTRPNISPTWCNTTLEHYFLEFSA